MPPKAKYTRKEIIQIALELVSEKGIDALNARNLGRFGKLVLRRTKNFVDALPKNKSKKCATRFSN